MGAAEGAEMASFVVVEAPFLPSPSGTMASPGDLVPALLTGLLPVEVAVCPETA